MRNVALTLATLGLMLPVAAVAQSAPGTSITTSRSAPSKSPRTNAKMRAKHTMKMRQKSAMMPADGNAVGTSITTKKKPN